MLLENHTDHTAEVKRAGRRDLECNITTLDKQNHIDQFSNPFIYIVDSYNVNLLSQSTLL